jgi:hypothetical protein
MARKDFSALFFYADKEFGIDWNSANDLFFNTILPYRSFTDIYLSDLCDGFDLPEGQDPQSFMEGLQITENMEPEVKARVIAGKFLISLGLTKLMIDCRG